MAQRVKGGAAKGVRLPPVLARGVERVAGAAIRAVARASRPRPRAVRVPGLTAETTVRFDGHGVPHVRAASEADAFRALGACHGLDRFFQMDMTRRLLSGGLCEVVGERPLGDRALPPLSKGTTLDADRLMRTLDLVGAAKRVLAGASADEVALLEAYCAGVNAVAAKLGARTSIEYRLMRLAVKPFRPLDCCLVAKGLALGLSFKWRAGPVFTAIAQALASKPAHLAAILPRAPDGREPTIARLEAAQTRGLAQALSFLGWDAPVAGSNSFVIGGGRSASGFPIVANDPHLELSLPPVWYLASVQGGPYAAVGATLPGVPGVVVGRSPTVAWAVTNAMLDDGDLWSEEIDGTGTRYRVDGAWRDLEVETQEIRRRGQAPFLFRLRRSHRGPLLSDALPGCEGRALSLRLMLHGTTRDMPVFLRLGHARTADDVERATEGYGSPAQNLSWATTEGIAGYRFMGRVPVRPGGEPALPRDGTTTASDWTGEVPPDQLPAFRLDRMGSVVTANDAHVGREYPHYLSNLYEPGYRAARLRHLLEGRTGLTPDDLAAMQMDAYSLSADAFRRAVLLPCAGAIRASRPPAVPMLDRLLASSGDESARAVGPALFHFTYYHLARRVFGRDLDLELIHRWMACVNLMDAPLLAAFTDPASPWAQPAVRATYLGEALEAAAKELEKRGLGLGATWGEVHKLTLRHPLSAAPGLGAAFTRGPFPMPGGPFTPQAGQYLHDRPAAMVVGASYRHVVDLADPEGSARMITFGGQSGHLGSPHYDDLTPIWMRGGFLPMRLASWPETGRDVRMLPG